MGKERQGTNHNRLTGVVPVEGCAEKYVGRGGVGGWGGGVSYMNVYVY